MCFKPKICPAFTFPPAPLSDILKLAACIYITFYVAVELKINHNLQQDNTLDNFCTLPITAGYFYFHLFFLLPPSPFPLNHSCF